MRKKRDIKKEACEIAEEIIACETDYHTQRTETRKKERREKALQEVRTNLDAIRALIEQNQSIQNSLLWAGVRRMRQTVEQHQNESAGLLETSDTAFAAAETALCQCIAGCLKGVRPRKRDTRYIASLLSDYRVFRHHQEKKPCISLVSLHSLLRDNYAESSLCALFDLMEGLTDLAEPKSISF